MAGERWDATLTVDDSTEGPATVSIRLPGDYDLSVSESAELGVALAALARCELLDVA